MARRHYSDADRAAALAVYDSTADQVHRLRDAAGKAGVPKATLRRWLAEREKTAAGQAPGHLKGADDPDDAEDTSWRGVFLGALIETANVTTAAERADVGRATVYDHRKRDPDFAKAWDEAKEIGADALEDEAVRRAKEGTLKPVFQGGELVGHVREYSDTLLIFLLKGAKPAKYRERFELTGKDGAPLIGKAYLFDPETPPAPEGGV